jgi:hypothetical protein
VQKIKRNITMAKKKKKRHIPKKRATRSKQTAPELKKRSKYPWLALIAGGVLVLTGAYFLYQGEKPPTQSQTDPIAANVWREGQESLRDSSRDTGGARSSLLLLPLPRKLRPQKPVELFCRHACIHMSYLYG